MSVRTLRWVSVIVPTAFVVTFEIITRSLFNDVVPSWLHVVVALGAVSGAAFAFSAFVFGTIASLEREVLERSRRLSILNALAADTSESLDVEQVVAATTRNVRGAMRLETVGLALVSEESGSLELAGLDGVAAPFIAANGARSLAEYDCECQKAVALGQPVLVSDAGESARCAGLLGNERPQTCAAVPIRSKGRTTGALFVARERSRPFARDELELIAAVGSQVGAVLENAQLFSKTEALAVLRERERVAREVHDGLAQTLGYLNVQLGLLDQLLAAGDRSRAQAELEEMALVTREAYQDLRQAITDLRTPLSSTGGLRRTLREYADKFSSRTGIPCRFEGHRGAPAILSPSAEVQVIRIVQEALANVHKHAPGSEVWLSVDATEREARVIIRDNGPGFDLDSAIMRGGQFGLQTMKERAASVGGALRIDSHPGAGTAIEVVVPLEGGGRR